MDEDQEEKKHFNMRDIIDDHKGKSKKKLKKKDRLKLKKLEEKESNVDDFKVRILFVLLFYKYGDFILL